MKVLFTSKIKGEITSFQPHSFQEIVEKTDDLDKKWRKKNAEPVPLDFMIFNEEGDKLYNGTYVVGSKETTNIYEHICQKLLQLPLKDYQQRMERDIFLQKLTSYTPASYQIDIKELGQQNKEGFSKWKQLSKRGRMYVSFLVSVCVIAVVLSITLAMIVNSQSSALENKDQELNRVKTMKQAYEMAMKGDMDKVVEKLQKKKDRSESEQQALIHFLVMQKKYDEAFKYSGKENASFLASRVMQMHGMKELKTFQTSYPSSVGAFELAYHAGNYKEAIAVKDVPMSPKLYKEKGIAYLKLDQIEEAKKMASEAKDDYLNKKINKYEELEEQLIKQNNQIESEKQSENENQDKIESLEEQKEEIENQQNNI